MKFNQWTLGLAALGVISLASAAQAEEAPHQVMTALSSTTLSGYVDTSAIWQFGRNEVPGASRVTTAKTVGRAYDGDGKQDGFNLNVVKLQLEKPLDEGQWSAGYKVGLLFGPDANTLNTASPTSFGSADFGVKDANVTLRVPIQNGVDVKLGVFESPFGYEVFDAGENPNYSRSLGYVIEPKVFTGVLASYKVSEVLSLSAGLANRGDVNGINARSSIESLKTYLATVTVTAPESAGALKGATLYSGVADSSVSATDRPGFFGLNRDRDIVSWYLGASIPTPAEGLRIGVAYDYRASGIYDSSYENALGGYLTYQATEKVKITERAEYATGSAGAWGVIPGLQTGDEKNVRLFGNTITVDYALWGPAITRAEVRWDHSLTGQPLYNYGLNRNAVSLALNVIYKF